MIVSTPHLQDKFNPRQSDPLPFESMNALSTAVALTAVTTAVLYPTSAYDSNGSSRGRWMPAVYGAGNGPDCSADGAPAWHMVY